MKKAWKKWEKLMKIGWNWWKLHEIAWNCMKLRDGEIFMPFILQENLRELLNESNDVQMQKSYAKLGEIGWNCKKLGKIAACNFGQLSWLLQFTAIWGNLKQFRMQFLRKEFAIFYILLILEIWAVQKYENLVDLEKCCKMSIWLLS